MLLNMYSNIYFLNLFLWVSIYVRICLQTPLSGEQWRWGIRVRFVDVRGIFSDSTPSFITAFKYWYIILIFELFHWMLPINIDTRGHRDLTSPNPPTFFFTPLLVENNSVHIVISLYLVQCPYCNSSWSILMRETLPFPSHFGTRGPISVTEDSIVYTTCALHYYVSCVFYLQLVWKREMKVCAFTSCKWSF